jgi:hypothetical protein
METLFQNQADPQQQSVATLAMQQEFHEKATRTALRQAALVAASSTHVVMANALVMAGLPPLLQQLLRPRPHVMFTHQAPMRFSLARRRLQFLTSPAVSNHRRPCLQSPMR